MNQERTRIFSHITRTRFLHVEDTLEIGKVRFFIGAYQRGTGADSTAYHFLDVDDARVLFADLGWSKAADFTDYKGTANGGDQPISRVMKVKGPKDGKYWLQIDNGPGQVIGQGAVKPAGQPEASISIAFTPWEMRKLALAITEYLAAYRVVAMLGQVTIAPPHPQPPAQPQPTEPPRPIVTDQARQVTARYLPATDDIEALFGPDLEAKEVSPKAKEVPPSQRLAAQVQPQVKAAFDRPPASPRPAKDDPAVFYQLAPLAINAGLLELVNELVNTQGPWHEKAARLQAALSTSS